MHRPRSRRLRERQYDFVLMRRCKLVEQPANNAFGFQLLFEPLGSRGVPADFAFLPFGGFGFESLFGDADLFFTNRQDGGLLVPFGSELIMLAADVVLELHAFELNLLAFDFEFVSPPAIVFGNRRAARFDATSNHFGIDGRQEFGPRLFHRQSRFQREAIRAFHFAAHHLEPLPTGLEFFEFQRPLFGLLLDRGEFGGALLLVFRLFAVESSVFRSDFLRSV